MKNTKAGLVIELPNTLSGLITLALIDLEEVQKMESRIVSMDSWHYPHVNYVTGERKCAVCFAGAVMDRTFKVDERSPYIQRHFSKANVAKFYALDYLRRGRVAEAIDCLLRISPSISRYTGDTHVFNRAISEWDDTGADFKKGMWELARDLEKAGL